MAKPPIAILIGQTGSFLRWWRTSVVCWAGDGPFILSPVAFTCCDPVIADALFFLCFWIFFVRSPWYWNWFGGFGIGEREEEKGELGMDNWRRKREDVRIWTEQMAVNHGSLKWPSNQPLDSLCFFSLDFFFKYCMFFY